MARHVGHNFKVTYPNGEIMDFVGTFRLIPNPPSFIDDFEAWWKWLLDHKLDLGRKSAGKCTCKFSCDYDCKGECGCEHCEEQWQDYLSMPV